MMQKRGFNGDGQTTCECWDKQIKTHLLVCPILTHPCTQEGQRRNSYSAAVIHGIKRKSRIYVGYSIFRKTDPRLSKGGVVVCLPGARIEHVTERVEQIMGRGNGESILVHVGTNNLDKEETTAIVEKYRNLLKKTKQAMVGQMI